MIYPKKYSDLNKILKKIMILLNRIKKPEYNFCRRRDDKTNKHFSHLDVCNKHKTENSTLTMDIYNFFPSITRKMVYDFFKKKMKCNKKVSKILSELTTYDDTLPQGFRTSPILAFYVAKPAFDEINKICKKNKLKFTLWVDDLQISGKGCKKIVPFVKKELKKIGLKIKDKKTQYYCNEISKNGERKQIMGILYKDHKMYTENKNESYKKLVEKFN